MAPACRLVPRKESESPDRASELEPVSGIEPLTCRLQGRFTQRVNLLVPRSKAVRGTRELPLMAEVFRLFWHECGTYASIRDARPRYISNPGRLRVQQV
jgi:hypothetical protein